MASSEWRELLLLFLLLLMLFRRVGQGACERLDECAEASALREIRVQVKEQRARRQALGRALPPPQLAGRHVHAHRHVLLVVALQVRCDPPHRRVYNTVENSIVRV